MKTLLVMAGVIAFLGVPRANATIELRLINAAGGGDTGWITLNSNVVSFNGTVGNYTINVSTSISSNSSNPMLDLNSTDNSVGNSNPGTLIVETIANGYTLARSEERRVGKECRS